MAVGPLPHVLALDGRGRQNASVAQAGALVVGFDLDLTLIDQRAGIASAMANLESEIGAGIDVAWVIDHIGLPLETMLARWVPPGRIEAAAWRYRELFEVVGAASTRAMPGAVEAVQAVRRRGGQLIVVTAKYEPHARAGVDAVGVAADAVFGWRFGEGKADALLAHGAEIYVGDHPADVLAARARGPVGNGGHRTGLCRGAHRRRRRCRAPEPERLSRLAEQPPGSSN